MNNLFELLNQSKYDFKAIYLKHNKVLIEEYTKENNLYHIESGIYKIYEYHKNGKITLIQYLYAGKLIGGVG